MVYKPGDGTSFHLVMSEICDLKCQHSEVLYSGRNIQSALLMLINITPWIFRNIKSGKFILFDEGRFRWARWPRVREREGTDTGKIQMR